MGRRIKVVACLTVFFFLMIASHAMADEPTAGLTDDQTQAIIDLLKQKGIITDTEALNFMERMKGAEMLQQAVEAPAIEAEPELEPATKEALDALRENIRRTNDAMTVDQRLLQRRVDDMESGVLNDLKQQTIKSSWAQRITLSGDLRLRYQQDTFSDDNDDSLAEPMDPTSQRNTTQDRTRFRYRARLGMKAKLLDFRESNVGNVEVGFRMTTGNDDDPVSTNDTMGDYFNRDGFVFDRAYIKYKWSPINPFINRMPQLSLVGGRFENPWVSSDLVWDSDVNFEGAALSFKTDTEQMRSFNIFLTAGIFPLQEEEFSCDDKWLWGGQLGIEYKPRYDMAFTLAAAYYDYRNIEGVQNTTDYPNLYDYTAPLYMQYGNTLMDIDPESGSVVAALATDYNILDLYLNMNFGFFYPIQIILEGQYVQNFGFDKERVALVTDDDDPVEDTDGYMVGATLGYQDIVNYGEWSIGLKYKYLGADAVLDAFTDSDFHLGGTNAKGWILKGELGLYRNVWLTARWLSSDEVEGPQVGVDTFQLDISAKF